MCIFDIFSNFLHSHLFISTFNMLWLFMVLFLWSHYLSCSFALAFFLIYTLFLCWLACAFFLIYTLFLSFFPLFGILSRVLFLFLGFEISIYVIILYFVSFLNVCSSFWKILGFYFNSFCRCIPYFLFSYNNISWDLTSIIFVVICVCVCSKNQFS